MKKLFFTLLVIATSMISFADDHKEKKDVDMKKIKSELGCLLYTSDAADE